MRTLARALCAALVLSCGHPRPVPPPAPPEDPFFGAAGLPVAVSPEGLMRPGAVRRIQRAIVRRGYALEGAAPGQLDEATRRALARFQRSKGLPATGLPGYATVEALGFSAGEIFHTGARR